MCNKFGKDAGSVRAGGLRACYLCHMRIRPLLPTDIAGIARLLASLAEEFIVADSPPEVASAFLQGHDAAGIEASIAAGMVYHVAAGDDGIAGFIGVRERSHIYHMFVDRRYQRRGLARALWHAARDVTDHTGVFTVNSSNYAVPVYEALGFVRTMPRQSRNGIEFNPMQTEGSAGA
jgi:GNAT superfamily N-acetyltransferase